MKKQIKQKIIRGGLTVGIIITGIFVVSITFLILSLRKEQNKIDTHHHNISVVSRTSIQLENISDTIFNSSSLALNNLLADLKKDSPSLNEIPGTEKLIAHIQGINAQKNYNTNERLSMLLAMVTSAKTDFDQYLLNEKAAVSNIFAHLKDYWKYARFILVFATLFALFGTIILIFLLKYKRRISIQKSRNEELLNNSIDAIIICDNDGKIVDFNKSAELLFGYSKKEILNQDIQLIYQNKADFHLIFEALNNSSYYTGNVVNITKNGKIITCQLSANSYKDEKGKVIGTIGISKDITEELTLKILFEDIITTATDIIYTSNYQGEFTYINPTFKRILGYSEEELIGKRFLTVISPAYTKSVEEHYHNLFLNKLSESYFEFKLIKKSGEEFWVGQHVKTKFTDSSKTKIEGFFGIVRDIDQIKKTQLKLKESEEQYRELIDNSMDLIHSLDDKGNFLYVNSAWKEALGYSAKELSHMNLLDIIHENSKTHCNALMQKIISTGECPNGKVRYNMVTKSNTQITVDGAVNVQKVGGKVVSIQSFLRDVTQQINNQEKIARQEQTLRQITETLNDVFYLYNIKEVKYEYISQNCLEVLGASTEFFYSGQNHTEKFAYHKDEAMLHNAKNTVNEGEPYEIEYRIVVDNCVKWINEKSFPIRDKNGEVTHNSGICRDITNFKVAEKIIQKQSREINESISYAKNIQDSALPSPIEIEKVIQQNFVFYQPKETLSGDFYIIENIKTNKLQSMAAFLVGDCTGHGVPGGVLSLLCMGLIRESFSNSMVQSPAAALDYVRIKLIKLFRANTESQIHDGMDVAFCVLDKENMELHFAGANRSCIIIRDGALIEIKGDRQHVGFNRNLKPFTNHKIAVFKGDLVILNTDGYVDQFGGPKQKKFMRSQFYQLLIAHSNESMDEINAALSTRFAAWKGDQSQIDDVTVLGVRF
ncbi:hypothetical protein DNU06_05970 [Putridiphycobacter roseus]|uniref:histidine kinase n=1 Tax=Putridiphycobacter roseus TaxID=2219161 RepID=A0A2W1N3L0_9FLAO|nr:PAS domain S-box protein [Putridiphycobacter roseus]PZE18160.1 hypothetical protein DNU06_05970 [Putridiphycobacter roseus]